MTRTGHKTCGLALMGACPIVLVGCLWTGCSLLTLRADPTPYGVDDRHEASVPATPEPESWWTEILLLGGAGLLGGVAEAVRRKVRRR